MLSLLRNKNKTILSIFVAVEFFFIQAHFAIRSNQCLSSREFQCRFDFSTILHMLVRFCRDLSEEANVKMKTSVIPTSDDRSDCGKCFGIMRRMSPVFCAARESIFRYNTARYSLLRRRAKPQVLKFFGRECARDDGYGRGRRWISMKI